MIPVDDTALAVTDTGGPGRPVVYHDLAAHRVCSSSMSPLIMLWAGLSPESIS